MVEHGGSRARSPQQIGERSYSTSPLPETERERERERSMKVREQQRRVVGVRERAVVKDI
jgi:hypothetical protein